MEEVINPSKDVFQSPPLSQDLMKEYSEAVEKLKLESEQQNVILTTIMKVHSFIYEQQLVPCADLITFDLIYAISNILVYENEAIFRKYCFSLLWSLSDHTELHQYFFETQYNLIPKLIHNLRYAFNDDEKYLLLVFFHNLIAYSSQTIHHLTRPNFPLLPVIAQLLTEGPPYQIVLTNYFNHIASILWNISEMGDDNDSEQIIAANLHQHSFLIIQHLISIQDLWISSDQTTETDPAKSMIFDRFSRVLNFFMNLASREVSLSHLHHLGLVPFMIPIARDQRFGSNRLKAIFIISFLIGRREYNEPPKSVSSPMDARTRRKQLTPSVSTTSESGESFRHIEYEDIETIIHVFELTLQGKGGNDYPSGTFCLRLIVKACLTISQSDSNKSLFLTTSIISLLFQVLSLFQENAKEIPLCGGGGEDLFCATLAIDTLIHLSFAYESDQDLQEKYLNESSVQRHDRSLINKMDDTTNEDVLAVVQQLREKAEDPQQEIQFLLMRLKENSKLTGAYQNKVRSLLNRLTSRESESVELSARTLETTLSTSSKVAIYPSTPKLSSSLSSNVKRPQHIMLSYSWKESAQPELVKRLHAELARKGFNVWRDEEGSLLVPSMNGSVDDRMAEALENSAVVIICVSAAYKLSANCRMEAKYASSRAKRDFLKILFVMMNEDYTTISQPEFCDGWLGIMIGDDLWYPLWHENQLERTSTELVNFLPETTTIEYYYNFQPSIENHEISCSYVMRAQSTKFSDQMTSTFSEESVVDERPQFFSASSVRTISTVKTEDSLSFERSEGDLMNLVWDLLHNPVKLKDEEALKEYLVNIGITHKEEIQFLDEEGIEDISKFLKKIPERAFRFYVKKIKEQNNQVED